jgi:hypothetical protein
MATSDATSEWVRSVQAGGTDSRRSFTADSYAESSVRPIPSQARSNPPKDVRPLEKAGFHSDVRDVLESSLSQNISIDESLIEITVRIGSMINASTFVVSQLPAEAPEVGERAYKVIFVLIESRFYIVPSWLLPKTNWIKLHIWGSQKLSF